MSRLAPLFVTCVLLLGSTSAFAQLDPALTQAPQFSSSDFEDQEPVAARSGDEADLTWRWDNGPRWMSGRSFNGAETFFESVARGRYFRGSTIGPDGDVSIEIVLSSSETTLAQVFRADQSWTSVGVGTFPGAVYDISDPDNPRRLNVVISEDDREQDANMVWDPNTDEGGGREYLWVMASDYDGTGTTYENVDNIAIEADDLDILYVWEGRLEPGRSFLETDPASLSILLAEIRDFSAQSGTGEVTLSWNYDAPPEADGLVIYQGTDSPAAETVAILDPSETSYTIEILDPTAQFYFRAEAIDGEGQAIDMSVEILSSPISALNMTLIGTLNPASRYGDIWGYVDPTTGREYALLCARDDGLFVIDVTDSQPVQVGFIPDGRDSKDIKTYGQYAYLVNEFAPIQIVDLADPTDPQLVGELDVQPGIEGGGSHNILVEGDYLYVVGGRSPGGLRIYSLADPTAPTFLGGIAGTDGETYYHDVDIVGDVLYAAAIYDQGVDILDISDKANPTVTSNFQYAAVYQGAHNICATEDGNYIFVGDEIGSEPYTRGFDVRDPDDVEQVSLISVTPGQPVHNCYVKDDMLYIAHYTDGVRVFDVTNPAEPVAAAFYDTYLTEDIGFRGNWTTYPYLPSGKILASDMQSGLFVLQLDSNPVDTEDAAPSSSFALGVSYPNPTTGATNVPFSLRETAHVRLTVYDILGREVAVLADGPMEAGEHTVLFDGSNLSNGAYFTRLDIAGASQTRPLTLLR